MQNLDAGYCVDVIYLDFQKAFDSVPHQRLLHKLTVFGICGKLLKWIENFLTHRKQEVVLNGCHSHSSPVISGVPQGFILGPLLFIMFLHLLSPVLFTCLPMTLKFSVSSKIIVTT